MARVNRDVYAHLLQTYGKSPGVWVGALLSGIARPLALITVTAVIMAHIAASIAEGDLASAQRYIIYLLLANLAGVVFGTTGELIANKSENNKYYTLLINYYRRLVGKDMAFYRDHQTGYLTSLFRQYLDSSMLLVRLIRVDIARSVVSMSAPVVVLFLVDWRLGASVLGIVMVQLTYIMWSSAKANKYREMSHEIYRKVTGEVADEVTNIVAFKSSGKEKEGRSKITRLAKEEIATFWLRRKTTALLDLPRGIITSAGVATAFWIAISSAENGSQSIALIVLISTYLFSIIRNVNELPNLITQHDDLVTRLHPTLEYLDYNFEHIRDPAKPRTMKVSKGEIALHDVSFNYPSHSKSGKEIKVFENLNITIRGGEHVGIVGLSGAGKSTLANLLMRFDDIGSGAITIDGIDIRAVKQDDLHKSIAYVPQEPLLFHRSIRENIAYFNRKASFTQIEKAAKAAHAHEFIIQLPDGYDTIVGERGIKLSGGQKQRVVIARSILKNAPIMVFDEATSALDSESEKIIQKALPYIIGRHTAIVIAHRLSTIASMDRILVMHAGKVVEEGTHEKLLKQKGRYHSLWEKQTSGANENLLRHE